MITADDFPLDQKLLDAMFVEFKREHNVALRGNRGVNVDVSTLLAHWKAPNYYARKVEECAWLEAWLIASHNSTQ